MDQLPALSAHAEIFAEQCLCCRGSEADEDIRFQYGKLRFEPWLACANFAGIRFLVNPSLSTWLPFEVLDGVRHVRFIPIDAGFGQRLLENAACRSHERPSLQVFLIA